MKDLEKSISSIVKESIDGQPDLFLVDVKIKGNIGSQKVLIFIDGDNGINIDHCSKVSRFVGNRMEELDFMPGKYLLEVSSPGLDHPITLKRQYANNVGRNLAIETMGNNKITGKLLIVNEENIVIETEKSEEEIGFNEIMQSKILVSFK